MLTDSKSGFLLPSGLTYVDFVIVEQLHTVDQASGSMLDSYPQLRQYKERVHALPGVRDYISGRPNSLL
jgi:glutathione S-transferase